MEFRACAAFADPGDPPFDEPAVLPDERDDRPAGTEPDGRTAPRSRRLQDVDEKHPARSERTAHASEEAGDVADVEQVIDPLAQQSDGFALRKSDLHHRTAGESRLGHALARQPDHSWGDIEPVDVVSAPHEFVRLASGTAGEVDDGPPRRKEHEPLPAVGLESVAMDRGQVRTEHLCYRTRHVEYEARILRAARWIRAAQHLVAFTGAGISTESGLPDYRGPDGVWTRRDAFAHASRADLLLVAGSSLVVTSAADLPRVAMERGARLILVNQGDTPFDPAAHLRFRESAGRILVDLLSKI